MVKQANILNSQITRFLITGGLAFAAEYTCFMLLFYILEAGLLVSNMISFATGLLISFSLNRLWVFNSKGSPKSQAVVYTVLAVINLFIIDSSN